MANIQITSTTQSSITCYIYNLDTLYAKDIYVYARIGDTYIAYATASVASYLSATSVTVNGLSSNTIYTLEVSIYYSNGAFDSLMALANTSSGSSLTTYPIYIYANPNNAYGTVQASHQSASYNTLVQIKAIANTGYIFRGWSYSPATLQIGSVWDANTYFYMPASEVWLWAMFEVSTQTRPQKFSWTKGAYNELTGCYEKVKGSTFDLTALEWQGLYDNINQVRVYKNVGAYDFYGSDAPVSKGDVFYSYLYNRAVFAIQTIDNLGTYGSNLAFVDPHTPIFASQLNDLMYAINSVT
jgi:hypothetical protein